MTGPDLTDPGLIALATRIQALFRYHGQSLADPETADAYRTSLAAVRLILDGALANDVVGAEQHETLRSMVDAAEKAPAVL